MGDSSNDLDNLDNLPYGINDLYPGKTIAEWLAGLPDDESYIKPTPEAGYGDRMVSSLSEAIVLGFLWHLTPEGEGFWKGFCKGLKAVGK